MRGFFSAVCVFLLPLVVLTFVGCNADESDWVAASESGEIESYRHYLEQHPEGNHTTAARAKVVELETARDWAQAETAGTVEAWEEFLLRRPDCPRRSEAESLLAALRDHRAWDAAREADTVEALRDYLDEYPEGVGAEAARLEIELRAWNEVSGSPGIEALDGFLAEFPGGAHQEEAQALLAPLLETRDWQAIEESPTLEGLHGFLGSYPQSGRAGKARALIARLEEDRDWGEASEMRTPEAFISYLDAYPEGRYRDKAQESLKLLRAEAEWSTAKEANTLEAVDEFLRLHPEGPFESDALELKTQLLLGKLGYEPAAAEKTGSWGEQLARKGFARNHFEQFLMSEGLAEDRLETIVEHLEFAATPTKLRGAFDPGGKSPPYLLHYRLGLTRFAGMPFVIGGAHSQLSPTDARRLHVKMMEAMDLLSPGEEIHFLVLPDLSIKRTAPFRTDQGDSNRIYRKRLISWRLTPAIPIGSVGEFSGNMRPLWEDMIVTLISVDRDKNTAVLAGEFSPFVGGGIAGMKSLFSLEVSLDGAAILDRDGEEDRSLLGKVIEYERVRMTASGDQCRKLQFFRTSEPVADQVK